MTPSRTLLLRMRHWSHGLGGQCWISRELLAEFRKQTLRECGIPESSPATPISTEVEKEVRAYHSFSYQDIEANISKLNSAAEG